MERKFVCIICPRGCLVTAELDNGEVTRISGNTCLRGAEYVKTECTAPVRTVTSTVRCTNGAMLPVKTAAPIPKEHMRDCMRIINTLKPSPPVKIGSVLKDDVYGSAVIASGNVFEK